MANSSEVKKGQDGVYTQFNDLRDDILDVTTGHDHTGTGKGKILSTDSFEDDSITEDKMKTIHDEILAGGFI